MITYYNMGRLKLSFILHIFIFCLLSMPPVITQGQSVNFPIREMSMKMYATDMTVSSSKVMTVANDARPTMLASPSTFASSVKYKSNHTFVKLVIDHAATTVPGSPFEYKMVYKIEGCPSIGSSSFSFVRFDTLVVTYNPDSLTAYQDVQVKSYPGLYEARVTILQFYDMTTGTPVLLSYPLSNKNFFVELTMQYQPYLKTHYLPADMGLTVSSSYISASQMLQVNWAPAVTPYLGTVTPAMYELEWTYIDNYGKDGTALAAAALKYNFRHNATRVVTDSLKYQIPVVYPKGYIAYRVRMVRVDSQIYRYPIYGVWSLNNASGTVNTIPATSRHTINASQSHGGDTINWNYNIQFAESGKFKHVLSYFDGLLKNRQTITRFNTKPNLLIAAENIYDYEGRPSISTIPSVIPVTTFRFQRNFSISNQTNLPYGPADFDQKPTACPDIIQIPPFKNNSLANKYYSNLNADTSDFQKYVPRAMGFPFTHRQFSPGFTDRIDQEGGVGHLLQIGGGHETTFEYTNADQPDLNRLFGINSGLSSFYNKTVSKDPNGQYSMTLKDNQNRLVVSSLIGASVDTSTHAIIFNDEVPANQKFKEDKLASGIENVTVGSEKRYAGNYYMDIAALTNVKYEFKFKPYTVCETPYLGLTVKGRYNYTIHDDCGVLKLHRYGFLGNTGVSTSPLDIPNSVNDVVSLEKGKHSIEKVLTVAEEDIVAAVDSFMAYKPNCMKTENEFIKEEIDKSKYPCPQDDACKDLAKRMMEELFTNAKYGKWRVGAGTHDVIGPVVHGSSIYDVRQWEPENFRYRNACVAAALDTIVVEKYGKTYKHIGTAYSAKCFKDTIYTGKDRYRIAAALLPLHPEYCKLQACFPDTFEARLKAIPDAYNAKKNNLFYVDSITKQDELLISRLALPPFNMLYASDSLSHILDGTVKMDTAASELAFCQSDDIQASIDAQKYFRSRILTLNFPNIYTENVYFSKLKSLYLSNREKYKSMILAGAASSCLPCDSPARMKLIPDPLIPVTFNPDGSVATDTGSLLGMFSDTAMTLLDDIRKMKRDGTGGGIGPFDSTTVKKYLDSTERHLAHVDSVLNSAAVDSIMSKMVNCFPSIGTHKLKFKDSLLAFISRGEVHNGIFLPHQIKYCITAAGLTENDLCHPYLNQFDYFQASSKKGIACGDENVFEAAKDFFNEPVINNILKSITTSINTYTPVWPATNLFALQIDDLLSGWGGINIKTQYIETDNVYKLIFYRPTSSDDSLVLSLKGPAKKVKVGSSELHFFQLLPGSTLSFERVSCFFEDPAASAEGYIGRFMFRAQVKREDEYASSTITHNAEFIGWNSGEIFMNFDASNPIANCIPCVEFRTQFATFRYNMGLIGGNSLNHPLFFYALKNYMNFKLKRVFSEGQYRQFVTSCALADYAPLPQYETYGKVKFPNAAHSSMEDFASDMALNHDIYPMPLFHYEDGVMEHAFIDYSTIPYNKLKFFNDFIASNSGKLKNAPDTLWGSLFLPVGTDTSLILANSKFHLKNAQEVNARMSIFLPTMVPYVKYEVVADSPITHSEVSQSVYWIENNISTASIQGYWFPHRYATVNADYFVLQKRAFLDYVYNLNGFPLTKVLDRMQPNIIPLFSPEFSGYTLSYINPSKPFKVTDLYYTNPSMGTPGFGMLQSIFNRVKATLGTNKIFLPVTSSSQTITTGVPPHHELKIYRCGDDLYWYRYFGDSLELFNVFVRVPNYIVKSTQPDMQLLGVLPSFSDGACRNFRVMLSMPGSPDTVYAEGTTDFDIAYTHKLADVLLSNESSYGEEEPLSGAPGGALNCEQKMLATDIYEGKSNYENYRLKFYNDLKLAFREHVMSQVGEKLWLEYMDMRFGTTLYTYDRAGNLMQTVPPGGITKITAPVLEQIDSLRKNNLIIPDAVPQHKKATNYYYNTLNKPYKEVTPDAGMKLMNYDARGNLVLSQTEKQRTSSMYTYFIYDKQNRLEETGQVEWSNCPYYDPLPLYQKNGSGVWVKTSMPHNCACENLIDSTWVYCDPAMNTMFYDNSSFAAQIRAKSRTDIVYTVYDSAFIQLETKTGMSEQENLRGRIGTSVYYLSCAPGRPATGYEHATHYSYDASGNVKTLTQDFPQLEGMKQRYKRIDYEYDLLSGKVNMISYNRGYNDQFYQRYSYDADNKLLKVETSRDGFIWKRDAEYAYYHHGPLARVSIGDQRVQGIDYAYTIQGWLKSINGAVTDTLSDMGGDGRRSTIVPKDVYATVIDYFPNDYSAVSNRSVSSLATSLKGLYNGNIARQSSDVAPFGALVTAYTYDQMNRIRKAQYAPARTGTLAYTNKYASSYRYDIDGNITQLVRRDSNAVLMDSLVYAYPNAVNNNKLADVLDYASFSKPGVQDITPYTTPATSRILYDEDGQAIKDLTAQVDTIKWNNYGKASFIKNASQNVNLHFGYDAQGFRTYKMNKITHDSGSTEHSTFYVREASGNILAEYITERELDKGGNFQLARDIRIGTGLLGIPLKTAWVAALSSFGYLTHPDFADYVITSKGHVGSFGTGHYLAFNPFLTQQFTSMGMQQGMINALAQYGSATGKYPLADALRLSMNPNNVNGILNTLVTSLTGNPDPIKREHAVLQLAHTLPDLYAKVADEHQITVNTPADSIFLFNTMMNIALNNPYYIVNELSQYYNTAPTGLDSWLNAVSSDSLYSSDNWLVTNGFTSMMQNALSSHSDAAAMNMAVANGSSKEHEGLYAFATWWSGAKPLLAQFTDTALLAKVSYFSDPAAYLMGFDDGYLTMDSALSKIPYWDHIGVASAVGITWVGWGSFSFAPAVKTQALRLGSHHIYGSSRLGIAQYWPNQYRHTWDYKTGLADTLSLMRSAWYSGVYNDVIDSGTTVPWGNGLQKSLYAQHLLGQKQYELTNHLGNVQATVSDKRYVKTKAGGLRDYFNAGIVAAYDYYPYGMLMPDRFVNDTNTYCVSASKTQYVPVVVDSALPVSTNTVSLDAFPPPSGTYITNLSGGGIKLHGQYGGVKMNVNVVGGIMNTITVAMPYICAGGNVVISVLEGGSLLGSTTLLSGSTFSIPGARSFSFTPKTGTVTVHVYMMVAFITPPAWGLFTIGNISVQKTEYRLGTVQVQLCNKGVDKYPFSWNTQMKLNEVAGTGNHYTAQFWEYSPRLGRRWNLDPVVKPWRSSYDVLDNSPIWKVDPDGDDDFFSTSGKFIKHTSGGSVIRIVDGKQTYLFSNYLGNRSYSNIERATTALGIANHYAPQAGVKGKVELGFSKNTNSPAHETGGTVKINAFLDPKNYKLVSNTGNVINTLNHEARHQKSGEVTTYADHARVYLGQILDKSFTEGTTKEYRDVVIGSFVKYTMNSFVQDANTTDAIEIMETFNNENKAGYQLSSNGGLGDAKSIEVKIKTKEGTSTMKYEKMSDPH
jgi:hypothetical protein